MSKASLDGADLGYSGFFSAPSASGKNTNNLFFWYQPCTQCSNVSEAPLLLWLQGGPGAPSTYGSLQEIGPYFIDGDCKIQYNQYTWCATRSCIFIDNPVMTGFSYQLNATGQFDPSNIEYTRTSHDAAVQIRILLDQFFLVFPEVSKVPFWVTGESYGGNYVPNVAKVVLDTNKPGRFINLQGVSVGDPVMNSNVQWPTYADTLYGMGLVNIAQREQIRSIMASGVQALSRSCKEAFDYWNLVWNDNGEAPQPFYYQAFSGSSTTYEQLLFQDPISMSWSTDWLATNQVARAMHYGNSPANQQNEGGPVYDTMVESGDFCQNSTDIYAELLTSYGINVQIYSSTNDPLLGPPCSEAGVEAIMATAGITSTWRQAQRVLWSDPVGLNGYATCFTYAPKSSRFCYTVVRNAGHMSPSFQSRACLDMTNRFMAGASFASPSGPAMPDGPACGGQPPFEGTADCACNLQK